MHFLRELFFISHLLYSRSNDYQQNKLQQDQWGVINLLAPKCSIVKAVKCLTSGSFSFLCLFVVK